TKKREKKMSSDDERGEEKELDHSSPEVVTKYKSAAEIVNKALRLVLSQCKPDHFSPLASDETVLNDMGCHIDGFIAVVAHTHVLHEDPPIL
ncbi:ERBB-3 binding protein 1-like protein, partial [Tanacetum coccineum]